MPKPTPKRRGSPAKAALAVEATKKQVGRPAGTSVWGQPTVVQAISAPKDFFLLFGGKLHPERQDEFKRKLKELLDNYLLVN